MTPTKNEKQQQLTHFLQHEQDTAKPFLDNLWRVNVVVQGPEHVKQGCCRIQKFSIHCESAPAENPSEWSVLTASQSLISSSSMLATFTMFP